MMASEQSTLKPVTVTRRQVDVAKLHVAASRAMGQEPDPFLLAVSEAAPIVVVPWRPDIDPTLPTQSPDRGAKLSRTQKGARTSSGRYVTRDSATGRTTSESRAPGRSRPPVS